MVGASDLGAPKADEGLLEKGLGVAAVGTSTSAVAQVCRVVAEQHRKTGVLEGGPG